MWPGFDAILCGLNLLFIFILAPWLKFHCSIEYSLSSAGSNPKQQLVSKPTFFLRPQKPTFLNSKIQPGNSGWSGTQWICHCKLSQILFLSYYLMPSCSYTVHSGPEKKDFRASMGFEPVASALELQYSTSLSYEDPYTGGRPMIEFINL